MELTSSAFVPNGKIPARYTCVGENISPPLAWSDVPPETCSFVVIMDDPDAQAVIGKTFDHWVVYDLPGSLRALPEHLPGLGQLPIGGVQGLTTRDQLGYLGPCPPPGQSHRYFFYLFAVDCVLGLGPGQTKAEILQGISGHILAQAELMGLFQR